MEDASPPQCSVGGGFQRYGSQCGDGHYHAALRQLTVLALAFGSSRWFQLVPKHFAITTPFTVVLSSWLRSKIGLCASQKSANITFPQKNELQN
jgi:hypothetical protein